MPVDERLKLTAQALLDNLAAALTTAGIDVPEHRYITTGQVAHDFTSTDCASAFIVSWEGTLQGLVSQEGELVGAPIQCAMPTVHQFTAALLRCVPTLKKVPGRTSKAPTAEELQASGEQLAEDAMTLAAITVDENVALLPSEFYQISIARLQPIGPQGGVGGSALTLTVGII